MQAAAAVEIEEAKEEEARLRQKLKEKNAANKKLTTEKEGVKERLNRCEAIILSFLHPLYTFIAVYAPIYTRHTCIYTIYTPNIPLNTLYTL